MLSNTDMNQLKRLSFVVTLSCLCSPLVFAESIDCSNTGAELKICSKTFSESRKQLNNKYLSAYLVTDAPYSFYRIHKSYGLNILSNARVIHVFNNSLIYVLMT